MPPPRLQSRQGKQHGMSLTQPPKPLSRQTSTASDASTARLFRSQNYDQDAEDNTAHMESFEDDDLEIADNRPPAFRSLDDELESAVEEDNTA